MQELDLILLQGMILVCDLSNVQCMMWTLTLWLLRRMAAGTLICRERDMTNVLMTSIVLKTNVTLLDIVSTRMLGQYGFLSKVGPLI